MTRPRRKNGEQRRADLINAAQVRHCCPTSIREPHLRDCRRAISRCADKVPYSSRDRAVAAAGRAADRGLGVMTHYRCASCSAWHIGHPKTAEEGLET